MGRGRGDKEVCMVEARQVAQKRQPYRRSLLLIGNLLLSGIGH